MMQFARNFDYYGAPVGLIVALDRRLERGQWADVGIYLAHLLLLAQERGLATCAQAAWAAMNQTVRAFLDMPEPYLLYCGVPLGYADPSAHQYVADGAGALDRERRNARVCRS